MQNLTNLEELDSYHEGYAAYDNGEELSDNPYSEDTDNQHSWNRGWRTAHIDLGDCIYGEEQ